MNGILLLDVIFALAAICILLGYPVYYERKQAALFNARMRRLALLHIARGDSAYGQERFIKYTLPRY